jgi:hypothetical protein
VNPHDKRLAIMIEDRLPQILSITATGPDVAWMDGNRRPEDEHHDDAVPDPVERWVRAFRWGLMGGVTVRPEGSSVTMQSCARTAEASQTWTLQLDALDWSTLRILMNLLLARRFDEISLRSEPSRQGTRAASLRTEILSLPEMPTRLPFAVVRAESVKATRGRAVKLSFAGAPPDEEFDKAIEALDLWAEIVLWGGYAESDMDPKRSGALPDGAIQYDEVTVAQTFTEAFFADEGAFEAVISYAAAVAVRLPIATVTIQ